MYFASTFLATLLVSANALATPHIGNDIHRRHQALVKVRAAAPEPVPQPVVASAGISNARLRKRCKPRPSNSSVTSTPSHVAFSAVSSSAVSSTASPAPKAPPPVNVAPDPKPLPATSSSPPPAPPSPAPTHSSAPAPSPPPPSQSPSSGGSPSLYSGTETGADITFYGAGLGACGIVNSDSDFIAAVSELLFDNAPGYNRVNPNTNPLCNKKVSIDYQGKQVTVTITDRCVACKVTDLDLTPTAFSVLADQSIGRLHGATWNWLS